MSRYWEPLLDPILVRAAERRVRRVVGTSGTLLNLLAVAACRQGEDPGARLHNLSVDAAAVRRLCKLLTKESREQRAQLPGLDAKRVDQIVVGACLANDVLQRLGADRMVACTWALREGVLLDFIARHRKGIEENELYAEPRRRSVARFARHLGESGKHAPQVARLGLQLFDLFQRRLELPAEAREWLEFAALLHDVGHHIGHKDHQRHSYYLITNGELLGFGREEIEIIAQTARYHRKATPKLSDIEYARLPKRERRVVRALSALLRIADGLDRSHYGVVRQVKSARRGQRLFLQLDTAGEDAELEMWEARRRAKLLQAVLGQEIEFQVIAPEERQHADRTASVSG